MNLAPATVQDPFTSKMAIARAQIARHTLAAGVASGLVLWTSFPPIEWNSLAWVAWYPCLWRDPARFGSRPIWGRGWEALSSGCWLCNGLHCSTSAD